MQERTLSGKKSHSLEAHHPPETHWKPVAISLPMALLAHDAPGAPGISPIGEICHRKPGLPERMGVAEPPAPITLRPDSEDSGV